MSEAGLVIAFDGSRRRPRLGVLTIAYNGLSAVLDPLAPAEQYAANRKLAALLLEKIEIDFKLNQPGSKAP